jgi:CarD family transcriptional regulator
MLHSAKQILISEIVLAQSATYEDVEKRINLAMA